MQWNECVIDASMGAKGGMFTCCPIEGDIESSFEVVTGMNFLGMPPKGMKMVAIVHPDGDEAAARFCEENREALDRLSEQLKSHDPDSYAGLVHDEQVIDTEYSFK